MKIMIDSPVPYDQRPIEEFIELRDSYFFSWPTKSDNSLYKNILIFWTISLPIFFIVVSGSYTIKNNILY